MMTKSRDGIVKTDKKFILSFPIKTGERVVELTRASAYALEGSGYIIPAPSTEEVWNFKLAPGFTEFDIDEVLKVFQIGRDMYGEWMDEN
jgi:hypothetical protein